MKYLKSCNKWTYTEKEVQDKQENERTSQHIKGNIALTKMGAETKYDAAIEAGDDAGAAKLKSEIASLQGKEDKAKKIEQLRESTSFRIQDIVRPMLT